MPVRPAMTMSVLSVIIFSPRHLVPARNGPLSQAFQLLDDRLPLRANAGIGPEQKAHAIFTEMEYLFQKRNSARHCGSAARYSRSRAAPLNATFGGSPAAAGRMKRIPAFVRGMVVRAVEDSCRRNSIGRVTVEERERIRARMPTPKFFG